jgi:preprotein translocase subunit Sec61beta
MKFTAAIKATSVRDKSLAGFIRFFEVEADNRIQATSAVSPHFINGVATATDAPMILWSAPNCRDCYAIPESLAKSTVFKPRGIPS